MRISSRSWVAVAVALASLFLLSACMISNSLSESSGSVSSISESITDSGASSSGSSSGEDHAALERDVRSYTALFTESGANVDAYLRGVSALCEQYAITDWQSVPAVRRGIALGLADSQLSPPQIDAFTARVAGGDPAIQESLRTTPQDHR